MQKIKERDSFNPLIVLEIWGEWHPHMYVQLALSSDSHRHPRYRHSHTKISTKSAFPHFCFQN